MKDLECDYCSDGVFQTQQDDSAQHEERQCEVIYLLNQYHHNPIQIRSTQAYSQILILTHCRNQLAPSLIALRHRKQRHLDQCQYINTSLTFDQYDSTHVTDFSTLPKRAYTLVRVERTRQPISHCCYQVTTHSNSPRLPYHKYQNKHKIDPRRIYKEKGKG